MNINYAQTFDEFASSLGPTDIALYAGLAMVLWVFFKDKLNPLTSTIKTIVDKIKQLITTKNNTTPAASVPNTTTNNEDVFFKLVVSWKQTRDLAVISGCDEAVKVADQMFPHLSPENCGKDS